VTRAVKLRVNQAEDCLPGRYKKGRDNPAFRFAGKATFA